MYSAWSPSSPSLDMEASLLQLRSKLCEPLDVAGNPDSSFLSEDPDVLPMDPFLDYINEVLMEEGMEDAAGRQQDADPSYQAILSSFYDIIGEQSLPNSSVVSSGCEDMCGVRISHQMSSCYEERPDEQHVRVSSLGKDAVVEGPINDRSCTGKEQGNSSVVSSSCEDMCGVRISHQMSSCYEERPDEQHVRVSSLGKDAVVEGPINDRSCIGKEQGNGPLRKEQGNGPFKVRTADEEFTLKLADIDISFQDLKLESVYTALYVDEPSVLSSATRPVVARGSAQNRDKNKSLVVPGKSRGKSGNNGAAGTAEVQGFVDLREVLVSCAQAVAVGDKRRANEILRELRQVHGVSAKGSGLQRVAHYFSEALVARMRGTGGDQYRVMTCNMPSAAVLLKATKRGFEVAPNLKTIHYFANQSILKAAEGASRLHILDCGISYGMQWPFLINALADRKGGPLLLVITAIQFSQLTHNSAQMLEETGQRLAAYARNYDVRLQYHAIATSKWEDLDPVSLCLHEDEVLVVNCIKSLRHLADESIDSALTTSPRQKFLTCMRNLNPHLLVFADFSAAFDSPFFVSRFREALYFYSNVFDMAETLSDDRPERLIIEGSWHYRDIINIVACEGAERVERPETYKQWQVRIKRAGFEQLPIPPTILSRSTSHVKQHYHKDFMVHDANGWLLLGWKGRVLKAISAWKPSPMYGCN